MEKDKQTISPRLEKVPRPVSQLPHPPSSPSISLKRWRGPLVAWCHAPWHYLPVYYIGTWWHAPAQATAALAANTGGGWIKWEAHLAADACRQPSRCEYRDPSCVWPLPSRFYLLESDPVKFRSLDRHGNSTSTGVSFSCSFYIVRFIIAD